ncbi:uncharacterized protein LOC130890755 [Diorhabda carinulata]|uniref:uncharacterized protein LOC130890755 n=1 Tax=Diorhabda carinulata TaxID=1163345 RepID=UPI0025A1D63C|nr:uncharacterized protein LOC130890755 [Diorhabda carinulata]
MSSSDKNTTNTTGSKSTRAPSENLDQSVCPASVDKCVHKCVPSSCLNKRVQPASTAAAIAPLPDQSKFSPEPPKQTAAPDKKAALESNQNRSPIAFSCSPDNASCSKGQSGSPQIKSNAASENPKDAAAKGSSSQCIKPKPVCKDCARPVCKDTSTVIKPPPGRPSFKTIALTAVALAGGIYLYETVLKDYIFGGPECACGCNKKK